MRLLPRLVILAALLAIPSRGSGQSADTLAAPGFQRLHTIGGAAEDRVRTAQLLGRASLDGFLIRSPSSRTPALLDDRLRWQFLAPELRLVWNSTIPFSLNEGTLWAGRGASFATTAGVRARWGHLAVTLAPEFVHISNDDVRVVPSPRSDRSAFSSPWHHLQGASADLPIRFGNEPLTVLSPGQSVVSAGVRDVEVGFGTENQWWGPGIRNAIVMSNHAGGIPHLFLRTASPVRTRFGAFETKWMAGVLTESLYFDADPANDHRSISGVAVAYRPAAEPDLALGFTRVVYRPVDRPLDAISRFPDVVTRWDGPPSLEGPSADPPGADQILSLFARWVFPRDGLELYTEWSRVDLPTSVRDFLTAPEHTRGYTLGMQWGHPRRDGDVLRLQAEITSLEKSPTFRSRPTATYYLGRAAPQGYTQRGQIVGASIGPGASSQWLAADYLMEATSVGLFAGRIRWENDAFYDIPGVRREDHDVSIFSGLRFTGRFSGAEWSAEAIASRRFNFLFQRASDHPIRPREAVDLDNATIRLTVTPFVRPR